MTELDKLIEEVISKEELYEEQRKEEGEGKKKKLEEDRQKAIDMRQKAMEKYSETKKRKADDAIAVINGDDDDMTVGASEKSQKPRKTGSETVEFLPLFSLIRDRLKKTIVRKVVDSLPPIKR